MGRYKNSAPAAMGGTKGKRRSPVKRAPVRSWAQTCEDTGAAQATIIGLVPPSPNSVRREHHMARHRRVLQERHEVGVALLFARLPALPVTVTITRCSVGSLDIDNLWGSQKAVIDAVAQRLGIDDKDARVTWQVQQRKCPRAEVGTVIKFERRVEASVSGGT